MCVGVEVKGGVSVREWGNRWLAERGVGQQNDA